MPNNRKDHFYYIWSAAIILCLALVLFTLIFVSCQGMATPLEDSAASKKPDVSAPVTSDDGSLPESEAPSNPDTPVDTSGVELPQTDDFGQEYLDRFVFLGDSTTYGLAAYGIVRKEQVWTPTSGTFSLFDQAHIKVKFPETGAELTIEEILELKKPEYMLVTLGVNGVSNMPEDWFKSEYIALIGRIKQASPDTKIIVNSIYPIANSYAHQSQINNAKIVDANKWIADIAAITGTRFLNSHSCLVNEDSVLPEDMQNGDGIHLTDAAFDKVMEYVRTHGYE